MDAIRKLLTAKEGTDLQTETDCQMAMVLIALLGGGDYAPEGMSGFGKMKLCENVADFQAQLSPLD